MKYTPSVPFTRPAPPDEVPKEHQESQRRYYDEYVEKSTLRCSEAYRLAQLALKLEEYSRRVQVSVKPEVVRDGIAKMAIIDILLRSDDNTVFFDDAFKYATEGLAMYGGDLLLNSQEDAYEFGEEFYSSFKTIEAYVVSGNHDVRGGTQLLEAI